MNTFTINNKVYNAKPMDFNTICDLEEMGVALEKAQEKPMSMVRAYFALHLGGNTVKAGKEIEAHVIGGGNFDEIMKAISSEMENSDFFQALNKTEAETTTESETETDED